jgi:hypothetical protein
MLFVSRLYRVEGKMLNEYGAVGAMRICKGNRSTRRKPDPALLCPLQNPRDLIWDRIRAAAVLKSLNKLNLKNKIQTKKGLGVHNIRISRYKVVKELIPPRWCIYFDVVVGLAGSNYPESYAGGSIATGRVTQAGQVEEDNPD